MPRSTNGTNRTQRRKKLLKSTKGYFGRRGTNLRSAKDAAHKAGQYAYRDRRNNKRMFRRLWITRISAACRAEGVTYSQFIAGLKAANIDLNRKVISNMAIENPSAFKALVAEAVKAK